jgi:signal transduction histidine kinase
MLILINDIIDISIIDSSYELNFQNDNFDIIEVFNFCFRVLNIMIEYKGMGNSIKTSLEIDKEVPFIINSDEMRIKQVLLNLISNSIKFTKKGHIKIKAKLINNNQIRISVEDSGIGIDKKN